MDTKTPFTRDLEAERKFDTDMMDTKTSQTRADGGAGDNDDDRLAELGHVQELKRSFSLWSLTCLCLCLMATWEALGSVLALALISGGAPCLFYNYVLAFLGTIVIALSLAELASMYPTAGGQYHWVACLAPLKQRKSASWFTAWVSIGGQICLTASSAFAGGLQLRGLISLNNPDYVPKQWHGMLFYWAVLAYALVANVLGSRPLSVMNLAAGVLHIAGFIAIIVTIGALSPKHSAHYVFVETSNETGWNDGLAWLIGMLSAVYPFLGYDAAAHMAEEIPHAARNVPLAMVGSVLANGVLGFAYCLVLLFGLGDLGSLLETTTGFPFMQLFLNITQSTAGASVMALIPTIIAVAANAAGLASTSRTFWAFARDDGMPASRFFAHVDSRTKLPIRMILLVSFLEMLLGFIYLASTTAFNAVLSMSIIGMYLSYALPIAYMLIYGRSGSVRVHQPGPFRLNSAVGKIVTLTALLWLTLAMFFSTWPNFYPVTSSNMNYSIVVLTGWMVIGAVYYLGFGRRRYDGPKMETTT